MPVARARPKSISLAPDFVSITLPGLRSRCTTPARCARSSASAIWAPSRSISASGSGPVREPLRPASRPRPAPSRGSRCRPRARRRSSVQMCGWLSVETVFASRSKRARTSGFADRCCGSTLTATSRPSRVSRARYTSPMPPAPSGASDFVGTEAGAGRQRHGEALDDSTPRRPARLTAAAPRGIVSRREGSRREPDGIRHGRDQAGAGGGAALGRAAVGRRGGGGERHLPSRRPRAAGRTRLGRLAPQVASRRSSCVPELARALAATSLRAETVQALEAAGRRAKNALEGFFDTVGAAHARDGARQPVPAGGVPAPLDPPLRRRDRGRDRASSRGPGSSSSTTARRSPSTRRPKSSRKAEAARRAQLLREAKEREEQAKGWRE